MLRIQNKCEEENDPGDEKLPATRRQKQLPVLFTGIVDEPVKEDCELPAKLLIWDAFISALSQFELLERVAYCNSMSPYLDQIMPRLFGLLPDFKNCKSFF